MNTRFEWRGGRGERGFEQGCSAHFDPCKLIENKLLWPKILRSLALVHIQQSMKEELNKPAFRMDVKCKSFLINCILLWLLLLLLLFSFLLLLFYICDVCSRNEPKEQSQDIMHRMLLKAITKGAVLLCIVLLYCDSLFCLALFIFPSSLPLFFFLSLLCVLFVFPVFWLWRGLGKVTWE